MNRQRKLIKGVCTIGAVGVLAAGVITTKPKLLTAFTLDESIEEQTDLASLEEQNSLSLAADTALSEETLQESDVTDDTQQDLLQETTVVDQTIEESEQPEENENVADNLENQINPENPENNAEAVNPNDSLNVADPLNPDSSADVSNPSDIENSENGSDNVNPENPENPDNVNEENPENPGNVNEENPDDINAENPENPDNVNEENPDNVNPDNAGNPSDSTSSDDQLNPDNAGNPSEITDKDNIDNSDNENGATDSNYPDSSFYPDDTDYIGSESGSVNAADSDKSDIQVVLPEESDSNDNAPDWIISEEFEPGKTNNAAHILSKKVVKLPKIVEDFRFWTVTRKYAFAREDLMILEEIPKKEEKDEVRKIGRIQKDGLLYVLKEEKNGWFYVESGRVRGFVKVEEVITGEEAKEQLEFYQQTAREAAHQAEQEYTGIEGTVPMAEEIVPWGENQAYTYLRATVNQTVIEKDYAIAVGNPAEVRESKNSDSRSVGTIPANGLCYILQDKDQEWIYIESGDVRGFVEKDSVQYGEEITKQVEENEEKSYALAEKKVEPQENTACYYTLTSIKSGIPGGEIRKSVVDFASQFIGNPYVWGGTSLTGGADCSGFVQSIFKQYGYELPRVACDQAEYGTKIPVEDALPGDLIFYEKDGYINHVVMYAGEGKTIEAQSSKTGIVCADVRTDRAVWATRFLKDNDYGYAGGGISEVNATPDMYGTFLGNYQLTYYCACEICCDVETGITATGAPVVEGRTIAVDPNVIPYGTEVIIGGHIFTAEDCGGAIKGNHIDIYVNEHAAALALGVNSGDVYLKK